MSYTQPKAFALSGLSAFTGKLVSGKTYQGLLFKHQVDLRGLKAITFTNCIFDAVGEKWGVRVDDKNTNAGARLFQHCLFINPDSSFVFGDGYTVLNSYGHDSGGDGFKVNRCNVVIQQNYITRLGKNPGSHADGVQIRGGKSIKIIGNYFNMPVNVRGTNSNANVFCQMDSAGVKPSNVLVDQNWCRGGNFSLQLLDPGPNCLASNNIFYSGSPRFGFGRIMSPAKWGSGNVTDSGKAATPGMK